MLAGGATPFWRSPAPSRNRRWRSPPWRRSSTERSRSDRLRGAMLPSKRREQDRKRKRQRDPQARLPRRCGCFMSASQQRLRADRQGTMSVRGDSGQCAAFASPSVAHATPAVALHVHVSHTRPTEQLSELLCELHCPLKWVLDQTRRLGITLTVILDSGVVVVAAVRVFWGASPSGTVE